MEVENFEKARILYEEKIGIIKHIDEFERSVEMSQKQIETWRKHLEVMKARLIEVTKQFEAL